MSGRLAAIVDGELLPEEDARALWERFSAYMDEHKGDLRGLREGRGIRQRAPGVAARTRRPRREPDDAAAPLRKQGRKRRTDSRRIRGWIRRWTVRISPLAGARREGAGKGGDPRAVAGPRGRARLLGPVFALHPRGIGAPDGRSRQVAPGGSTG